MFYYKMKVCVAGGSGFIGTALAKELKHRGHFVRIVDIQDPLYSTEGIDYDEFFRLDLRIFANCCQAVKDCDWTFNLAALMGGMGTIASNNAIIMYSNMLISSYMLEAARINGIKRFFYSSSACVYPEYAQTSNDSLPLKENDAWPAHPQDAYGLEKLCSEELALHYANDYGMDIRIARYHNIYGPYCAWVGGKEKSPAAIARKALVASDSLEIWGSGEQTRSYCYIDDCIEGTLRLFFSDYNKPLNIGSTEQVSINSLANLALNIVGKSSVNLTHIDGPIGVNGRNSDNTLIKSVLNWEPSISLRYGMEKLIKWIKSEIDTNSNCNIADYHKSEILRLF